MNKPLIFILLGIALVVASVVCHYARVAEGWALPLVQYGACFVLIGLLWASWGPISEMISRMLPDGAKAKDDFYDKRRDKTMKHDNLTPEELRIVSAELRKQVDRLSFQVNALGNVASSAEHEVRLNSLQKSLMASQTELKLAKDSLNEEKKSLESAEVEKHSLLKETARLLSEQAHLKSELKYATDSHEKLVSAETSRLEQMVPAGLLDSTIGQTVKWCAAAAARGDRVAAQIFASLQSIKAAQGDDELKGLLLSSLQVLGQSIRRFSEREGYSPEQKYDILSNWSSVLNEISASRFTLIVPSIGARLNLSTMVSSGAAGGNVNEVHCWGVMNENRDLYSPASVS